jgi:hypothetical protein
MEFLKLALLRIKALFTREAIERDMHKEMSVQIEYFAEEYRQQGMSAEEARYAASRRRFGNLMRLKELGGEIRGGRILESLARHVRQTIRSFRRTPFGRLTFRQGWSPARIRPETTGAHH